MNKDWREQGQEKYLSYLEFWKVEYVKHGKLSDHDHCEFCWKKFCELKLEKDCLQEGYTTKDNYRWICVDCFMDFREKYNLLSRS